MNAINVQAIITTLETLLSVTLGYNLEDISTDPDVDTTPAAQIIYQGEDFEQDFHEQTLANEVNLNIRIQFNLLPVATNRDLAITRVHELKTNIKRSLFTSVVALVSHTGSSVDYDAPITTIDYALKIRYFDTERNI